MTIESIGDGMVPFNLISRSLAVMGGLTILASDWLIPSLQASHWLTVQYSSLWPLIGVEKPETFVIG